MSESTLTELAFREVGSRYASGVVVVTSIADGFDHAMTATSFTTVSLDPMLVLICVEKNTRFHDVIATDESSHAVGSPPKTWGISILNETARPTASWFATKGRPLQGQFDRYPHYRGPATGTILLNDSLATIEAITTQEVVAGDHVVIIGEVLSLRMWEDNDPHNEIELGDPLAQPLTYWARRYHGLTP